MGDNEIMAGPMVVHGATERLWFFAVRRRELEVMLAALSGRRLSADDADLAQVMADHLEELAANG